MATLTYQQVNLIEQSIKDFPDLGDDRPEIIEFGKLEIGSQFMHPNGTIFEKINELCTLRNAKKMHYSWNRGPDSICVRYREEVFIIKRR